MCTGPALSVFAAGGSSARLEAMLALRALGGRGIATRLVAPDPDFLYRPMAVARPFGLGEIHRSPLGPLAERGGSRCRTSQAGAPVQPTPLDPVLRALLLTEDRPAYVRAALGGHHGDPGVADWEPLWWPPAKVAGLHLAPFSAENPDLATGA